MVKISISDSGCGIEPHVLKRVFERFYKRHPSIEGSGLGLSICKEITDLYHGEISVISKGLKKGSKVILTLPS